MLLNKKLSGNNFFDKFDVFQELVIDIYNTFCKYYINDPDYDYSDICCDVELYDYDEKFDEHYQYRDIDCDYYSDNSDDEYKCDYNSGYDSNYDSDCDSDYGFNHYGKYYNERILLTSYCNVNEKIKKLLIFMKRQIIEEDDLQKFISIIDENTKFDSLRKSIHTAIKYDLNISIFHICNNLENVSTEKKDEYIRNKRFELVNYRRFYRKNILKKSY